MPLRITFERADNLPLDLAGITPDRLLKCSPAEVERLPIRLGCEPLPLADLCRVTGDARDGCLELVGDFSHAERIGVGMSDGFLTVDGNVGNFAGAQMHGGELHIHGNAGDLLGAEMRGGVIRVLGNVRDFAGANPPGSKRGMNRGTILIHGDAGQGLGTRMRRGLIAVAGSAGAFVGRQMLAGTIVVGGSCGQHAVSDMQRGTLFLLARDRVRLPTTFRAGSTGRFAVLALLARELQSHGFSLPAQVSTATYQTFHGDFLHTGRGEVFQTAS